MQIDTQEYLDFDDVLIKPKRSSLSSRKEVSLEREFTFLHSKKCWNGVPIMASNMDTVGTWEVRNALSEYHMPTMIHKFYTLEDWFFSNSLNYLNYNTQSKLNDLIKYTIPSFGIRKEDTEKLYDLIRKADYFPEFICFDVANGYTEKYVDHIKQMRDRFSDSFTIIAGNVATPEGAEALIFAGADIIKNGIGSGKQCLTRMKAGVGVPQLTATQLVADAVHGLGAHMISDGGIKQVADVSKAFGAGADMVMIGSIFAGHAESGGKEKEEVLNGKKKKYKEVYGMSSDYAMTKHYGLKDEYRASEGDYSWVEHKGEIKNTIEDILGGLRSTMTYIGARRLKDVSKCTTFVKVNRLK